jgi:hypothetical protein
MAVALFEQSFQFGQGLFEFGQKIFDFGPIVHVARGRCE